MHLLALDDRRAWSFSRSAGHRHDAPEGRRLLQQSGLKHPKYVMMDRAYEDDRTRQVVQDLGATPVVPPRTTRRKPWSFDRQLYARRNEVERLFGRLKRYRRVGTRYDKLDVMFAGFIYLVLIYEMIRNLV